MNSYIYIDQQVTSYLIYCTIINHLSDIMGAWLLSLVWILLAYQPRLVYLQTLGFYTLLEPVHVYHQVEYAHASFTLSFPDFSDTLNTFRIIDNQIKKLNMSIFYINPDRANARQVLLRNLFVNIVPFTLICEI